MTVGESLTQARKNAGLTIDELSERTKIRATVIRSIEADDYEACGGDLYVRGYVRAIAGAIGVDAQGLIRDYDQERVHAIRDADATMFDLPAVAASGPPEASHASEASPAFEAPEGSDPGSADRQDPDETRFDLPAVREDSAATRFDIPAVRADQIEDLMAAGYEVLPAAGGAGTGPGAPAGSTRPVAASAAPGPDPRAGRGRRLLVGVGAVAVLVLASVIGVRLASGSTTAKNAADSTAAQASASARASTSASPATSAAADTKPAAKPTAKPSANPTPARPQVSQPVMLLPLAAAEAFGPGGLGDGDNPSGAANAIASNPRLPWSTNWYTTAKFGMLKSGTGLLVTLGHQATITSVRIDLTGYRGVNLQLKVGDGTSPQDFRVAAAADNAGGTVRLTLRQPTSARYLLIWFTQLPPNGAGQYQESVYHVLVNGRR